MPTDGNSVAMTASTKILIRMLSGRRTRSRCVTLVGSDWLKRVTCRRPAQIAERLRYSCSAGSERAQCAELPGND
jgi:hypothetical protein